MRRTNSPLGAEPLFSAGFAVRPVPEPIFLKRRGRALARLRRLSIWPAERFMGQEERHEFCSRAEMRQNETRVENPADRESGASNLVPGGSTSAGVTR